MYTGTRPRDWDETATHGAAVVQRVEAGLPWEQDAERNRADQDGWLLSFIDVLTLLLTLFVLLLAYQHGAGDRARTAAGQADARPLPERVAAQDHSRLPPDSGVESEPMPPLAPAPDYLALADLWTSEWLTPALLQLARAATPGSAAVGEAHDEPRPPLESGSPETVAGAAETPLDPVDRLLAELDEPALQGRVEVTRQPGGLDLEISDSILFTPASAALTDGGRALLDDLAGVLASLPYELSVEGHTDDRPIATERYPSNWELASARASGVTRHLVGRGIAADRLRAVGYADTRPLADNASAEGRARNRRVSFILRMPAP